MALQVQEELGVEAVWKKRWEDYFVALSLLLLLSGVALALLQLA